MTIEEEAKKLIDNYDTLLIDEIYDEFARKYAAKSCAIFAIEFALSQLEVKIRPKRLDIQILLNKNNLNKLKEEIQCT